MLLIHYVQLHQKAINLTQAEKSNRNQISQQDLKSSVRHQKKRLKVFANNQIPRRASFWYLRIIFLSISFSSSFSCDG